MNKFFSLTLLLCSPLACAMEPQSPTSTQGHDCADGMCSMSAPGSLSSSPDHHQSSPDSCLSHDIESLSLDHFKSVLEQVKSVRRYQMIADLDCPDAQEFMTSSSERPEEVKTPRTHLKELFAMHTGYIPEDCGLTQEDLGNLVSRMDEGSLEKEALLDFMETKRVNKKAAIAARLAKAAMAAAQAQEDAAVGE